MFDKRNPEGWTRRAILYGGAAATIALPFAASASQAARKAKPMTNRFNRERFAQDCASALHDGGMPAVHEVLQEAVSDHRAVLSALGDPTLAGLDVIHRSNELTIFAAHWTPQMNLLPHDHMMEAIIGIYTGREDNIIWQRGPEGIEAIGANCLFEGDVAALPADAIHSVTNPLLRFTGGIHIYDGDFFATPRHQWDPETLAEEPSDGDTIRSMFARENERFRAR